MSKLQATWTKVAQAGDLQRSSQTVSVVNGKAFVFGGELQPRQPRDNTIFKFDIDGDQNHVEELKSVSAAPSRRVGAASAVLGNKVYLFGGRGGESMSAIEEKGSVWTFNTETSIWAQLSLATTSDVEETYPAARSYHCATSDGADRFYVHAGCPVSGRLADLWSWHAVSRAWMQHADAPGPPRGGPSLAFHDGLLYRMNGFDGKTEQGGCLDIFTPTKNEWQTKQYKADGVSGPAPRSVGTLLPITIDGKAFLVTVFGEGDPSSLGHAGAGKMFDDIWAYGIEDETWQKIQGSGTTPKPRGWFDADVVDQHSLLISGGLGEDNDRLDDAWLLSISSV